MSARLVVLVVRNLPDIIAAIRGSVEQNSDDDAGQAVAGKQPVPIHSGTWGRGVSDASVNPLRAWGFWVSTLKAGTKPLLDQLVAIGVARYFVWDDATETHTQFMARWQSAVNWTPKGGVI